MTMRSSITSRGWSLMVAVLLLLPALPMTVPGAAAQQAPAGNEHPQQTVSADFDNPLGAPEAWQTNTDPRPKHEFAEALDLSPLEDLAVLTNSRLGTFDTLARQIIGDVVGRSEYLDFIGTTQPGGKTVITKARYEPAFTLLDLMADTAYYLDKPLIHVEQLALRKAILAEAFPGDDQLQEQWLKYTRVSPRMVILQWDRINGVLAADSNYTSGIRQLGVGMQELMEAHRGLMMVPADPSHEDQTGWRHVTQDPRAAELFASLGDAWRARDVTKVNSIVREIADYLPGVNPAQYPAQARRTLETMYNGTGKYMLGYTLYFAALISLLIALGTGRKTLRSIGIVSLVGGLSIHLALFVTRWILAERIPIQNQFESMLGLCLGACLFGTITMFVKRQTIFGAAAAGVGFLTLMTAVLSGVPGREIGREAAILNTSNILFYHVNSVLFSYGLIALGMVVSAFYLVTHYFRSETAGQFALASVAPPDAPAAEAAGTINVGRQRLLGDLDKAQMVILQLAFWILGVGILLGAWWADHSWGRWWAFDPKETWALITWIIYLIIVHVRFGVKSRGLVTAWLSIIGFLIMLWTYFGVNLILPGLHAYA